MAFHNLSQKRSFIKATIVGQVFGDPNLAFELRAHSISNRARASKRPNTKQPSDEAQTRLPDRLCFSVPCNDIHLKHVINVKVLPTLFDALQTAEGRTKFVGEWRELTAMLSNTSDSLTLIELPSEDHSLPEILKSSFSDLLSKDYDLAFYPISTRPEQASGIFGAYSSRAAALEAFQRRPLSSRPLGYCEVFEQPWILPGIVFADLSKLDADEFKPNPTKCGELCLQELSNTVPAREKSIVVLVPNEFGDVALLNRIMYLFENRGAACAFVSRAVSGALTKDAQIMGRLFGARRDAIAALRKSYRLTPLAAPEGGWKIFNRPHRQDSLLSIGGLQRKVDAATCITVQFAKEALSLTAAGSEPLVLSTGDTLGRSFLESLREKVQEPLLSGGGMLIIQTDSAADRLENQQHQLGLLITSGPEETRQLLAMHVPIKPPLGHWRRLSCPTRVAPNSPYLRCELVGFQTATTTDLTLLRKEFEGLKKGINLLLETRLRKSGLILDMSNITASIPLTNLIREQWVVNGLPQVPTWIIHSDPVNRRDMRSIGLGQIVKNTEEARLALERRILPPANGWELFSIGRHPSITSALIVNMDDVVGTRMLQGQVDPKFTPFGDESAALVRARRNLIIVIPHSTYSVYGYGAQKFKEFLQFARARGSKVLGVHHDIHLGVLKNAGFLPDECYTSVELASQAALNRFK